jgi:hypothetical protein
MIGQRAYCCPARRASVHQVGEHESANARHGGDPDFHDICSGAPH